MIYRTCVTISAKSPKEIRQKLTKALKKSDYAELRLDFLKPSQIPDVLEVVKKQLKKCVCTLRPFNEGGNFKGTERERISIIKLISEYNPYLLDVEYKTLQKNQKLYSYLKKSKTKILVSWHDFKKTPSIEVLETMRDKMKKYSNHVKIVTTSKYPKDSAIILALYANLKKINLIAFSMGESGKMSRILCLYLGAPFTYVSLGKPVAPGQFSLEQIKKLENIKKT